MDTEPGLWRGAPPSLHPSPDVPLAHERPTILLPSHPSASPPLVSRWEAMAHAHPLHEAVRADGHASLTYASASETAHRWVNTWREKGLKPGDRVLLRCPAGPCWVVAVWAAQLAGLCWTACGPDVPPEHAAAILQDLAPRLIVDAPSLLDQASFTYRPITHIPTLPGTAYIAYATGSTGTPRGVVVLHEGIVPMIDDLTKTLAMDEPPVALWMRSPTSDSSLLDVGVVLASGGTLVVEPRQAWRHHEAWERLVVRHGITLVNLPSSCLSEWAHRSPPPVLRTVIASASAVPAMMVRAWAPRVRWLSVHHRLETSVCMGLERWRVDPGNGALLARERPMHGLRYRVLPPTASGPEALEVNEGELWVGGPGVAGGYWRRPALSARRFVTDAQGTRWFRTGQLMRRAGAHSTRQGFAPQRVTQQGHALDLDEVEAVLQTLPGLTRVSVWQDVSVVPPRLVAAVQGEGEVLPLAWKQQAAERLPGWAMPQHWWWADTWPLTEHGTVDQDVLRARWAQGHPATTAWAPLDDLVHQEHRSERSR